MSFASVGAETVRLGTFHIPLLVESPDSGLFIDMAVFPIFFAFQPDDRGRDLAARFTTAIRSLNERGEISQIMNQP